MQNEDGVPSTHASRDPEWPTRHPALDAALAAAIRARAPAADTEFDQQVWARIRIDATADRTAPQVERRVKVGAPLWLNALNAIAITVVVVVVVLALGTAVQPAAKSARVAQAVLVHSPSSMHMAVFVVSTIGLWLGLRWTSWARVLGLSLGLERVASRR